MKLQDSGKAKPSVMVFWVFWFAIFNGLFVVMFLVGGGWPSGVNEGNPPVWMVVGPSVALVASAAVRFLLIPKVVDLSRLLPMMVAGLALADSAGIFAVFVVGREFPETRQALFLAAVGAIVLHAPVYLNRILEREKLGR